MDGKCRPHKNQWKIETHWDSVSFSGWYKHVRQWELRCDTRGKEYTDQSCSLRHFSFVIWLGFTRQHGFFFFCTNKKKRFLSFIRFNHLFQLLCFYSCSEDLLSAQCIPRRVLIAGDTTLKTERPLSLYSLNTITFHFFFFYRNDHSYLVSIRQVKMLKGAVLCRRGDLTKRP